MQVLDHQHDRRFEPGPREQVQQRFEQARLGQWIDRLAAHTTTLKLGQQPPELSAPGANELLQHPRLRVPHEGSEGPQQGGVRKLRAAHIDTATGQHARPARTGEPFEFPNQTRLSDAGLTANEDGSGITAVHLFQRSGQSIELLTPAHECWT